MKKIILITGASRGLGAVMVSELSKNKDYKVYGTSRQGDNGNLLKLDVTSDASVKACIELLLSKEGRIDVLINNVGSNLIGSLEGTTLDNFKEEMDLNFYGAIRMIHEVMPVFRKRGRGRIINISSIGGRIPLPFNSTYSASKAALEAATETLSYELIGSDIYASLIEPLGLKIEDEKPQLSYVDKEKSWHSASRSMFNLMMTKVNPSDTREGVAKVANKIIQSKKPKLRYSVSFPGAMLMTNKRLLPFALLRKVIYKTFVKD